MRTVIALLGLMIFVWMSIEVTENRIARRAAKKEALQEAMQGEPPTSGAGKEIQSRKKPLPDFYVPPGNSLPRFSFGPKGGSPGQAPTIEDGDWLYFQSAAPTNPKWALQMPQLPKKQYRYSPSRKRLEVWSEVTPPVGTRHGMHYRLWRWEDHRLAATRIGGRPSVLNDLSWPSLTPPAPEYLHDAEAETLTIRYPESSLEAFSLPEAVLERWIPGGSQR